MSYIHEALKKAQVERDLEKRPYGGIPVSRRKKSFFTAGKIIFPAALLLMVLLAFAGYSWWDLTVEKRDGAPPDIRRTNPTPKRQAGTPQNRRVTSPDVRRMSPTPTESVGNPLPAAVPRPQVKSREDIAVCYQKARAFHREGRLPEAGMWYEKVISMDPGHVEALNNRGVLHLHKKNYSAARKCFEKAIRLKPDYVDPYYNRACVSVAQGKPEQGLRYLKKAVSMNPAVREWAQKDPDLDVLRSDPGFKMIVTNEKRKSLKR